jgi:para-nitrobenzyl esterase
MSAADLTTAANSGDARVATPAVATRLGRVRGYVDSDIHVFKGIAYGAATHGERRFMPPVPPAPWSEVRDAFEYGDQSPQITGSGRTKLFRSWRVDTGQSEDCLRLNVWTPSLRDGKKRPVMVWFHGGGFSSLNGSSRAYEGTRLTRRGDVVVVTLNHRLNVFGYLYLAGLGDSRFERTGITGQLDLIAALEWVRDNIEEFGGDPDNVMIFGESGGGAKVCTLLAMPAARGLFHRAAVQSGPMLSGVTPERATGAAVALLEALGLRAKDVHKLLELPVDALVNAYAKLATTRYARSFAPVVSGDLPRHPFDPDAPALSAEVPLIVGFNKDETSLFVTDNAIFELDWAALPARITSAYRKLDAPALISRMRELRPNANATQVYFAITTAVMMGANSIRIAERKAARKAAPAYLYQVQWETPVEGGRFGSPHAVEIPFVFDTVGASASMVGEDPTAPQKLAEQMSEAWLAFARTGNPNTAAIPDWPAYDVQRRATMVFDTQSRVVDDFRSHERQLFESVSGFAMAG